LELVLTILGLALLVVGAFLELVGTVGILRLRGFFNRLHAATVSAIGGSVVPLLGLSLLSVALEDLGARRFHLLGICLVAALLILILAPAGAHALARAAYRSGEVAKDFTYDAISEDGVGWD